MSVKAGFKRTDVGVFPEDWEVLRFSDHFRIYAGGDVPKHSLSSIQSPAHPYPIFANALTNHGLYGYTAERRSLGDSVTVTARGYLGHAEYRTSPFFPIVRLLVLEPTGRLDARFCAYAIKELVEFAVESTGVPQLTAPQVAKYVLVVPPSLDEQRAIAAVLGDVDALLSSLDKLIAKKRDLKQGAMQQLLTGKTRLPGFNGKWEVKQLGDRADIDPDQLGGDTKPGYEFKYISLEEVDHGSLRGFSSQVFRSAPSRARRKLRVGDVLVSTVRPNLKSHLHFTESGSDWVCSTGFTVIRCREGVTHPGFVFAHLFSDAVSRQIDTLLSGSNYPAINSGDVRRLRISFPAFDEQAAIATALADMGSELVALEARRDKTRAIKQGMMQELLMGRKRLK